MTVAITWLLVFIVSVVVVIFATAYVIVPFTGSFFRLIGRCVRFFVHEIRDLIRAPILLIRLCFLSIQWLLVVVLGRWQAVHHVGNAIRQGSRRLGELIAAIVVDHPLRVLGIEPETTRIPPHRTVSRTPRGVGNRSKFPGYHIVGTLPSGGSGATLYVAERLRGDGTVVIKSFALETGSALPQIVRESRSMDAARKLGLVIEHHLDDRRFWYVMPHHTGDNLGAAVARLHTTGGLSADGLKKVLELQRSLVRTLQRYHRAGLWHKDVKPENILVGDDGVHLVDIGLVTPLASAMTLTTHGTEYFRDPELVRQAMRGVKVHEVDGTKFDVYGAGAVLFFMLENTFPAHGGLSSFEKKSPEGIRWIVRRAMADYARRYESAAAMLEDIEFVLSSPDVTAVRPADLPSMQGQTPTPVHTSVEPIAAPIRRGPSTGHGPFAPRTPVLSQLAGLVVLVAVIIVGVQVVQSVAPDRPLSGTTAAEEGDVSSWPRPTGPVLMIRDRSLAADAEMARVASGLVAQLSAAGWSVMVDSEKEARFRRLLPTDLRGVVEGGDAKVRAELTASGMDGLLLLTTTKDGSSLEASFVHDGEITTAILYPPAIH